MLSKFAAFLCFSYGKDRRYYIYVEKWYTRQCDLYKVDLVLFSDNWPVVCIIPASNLTLFFVLYFYAIYPLNTLHCPLFFCTTYSLIAWKSYSIRRLVIVVNMKNLAFTFVNVNVYLLACFRTLVWIYSLRVGCSIRFRFDFLLLYRWRYFIVYIFNIPVFLLHFIECFSVFGFACSCWWYNSFRGFLPCFSA